MIKSPSKPWVLTSVRRIGRAAATLMVAACRGHDAGITSGAWEFKVDTIAESDGGTRQTSWLRAAGKEGPIGSERTNAVMLSFDCFRGNTSSTIMTNQALRQGSVEVQVEVDSDPARRIPGFAGTTPSGGKVLLMIPQDSLLALLSGHQRALIEYADGAGSSKTTAELPIAGLEKLRAPFLAACAKRGREEGGRPM